MAGGSEGAAYNLLCFRSFPISADCTALVRRHSFSLSGTGSKVDIIAAVPGSKQ